MWATYGNPPGIDSMNLIEQLNQKTDHDDVPEYRPRDTVAVHVNIVEGKTQRIQVFEGYVLARQGTGISETFTVRKTSFGVGIERQFPVHSPIIDKIEVKKRGQVRRAKLYYMRDRHGKAARIPEKR